MIVTCRWSRSRRGNCPHTSSRDLGGDIMDESQGKWDAAVRTPQPPEAWEGALLRPTRINTCRWPRMMITQDIAIEHEDEKKRQPEGQIAIPGTVFGILPRSLFRAITFSPKLRAHPGGLKQCERAFVQRDQSTGFRGTEYLQAPRAFGAPKVQWVI